ncbi:MAG: hypothetical protein OHK93_002990 [Ramalina farinacea]|uniref:Uncharacterized protein n=1 Tax=Ramalina farinacea TaxID=258253 RepID=A0AA43QUF9_9LECA|nr:hypothetical protein [Ramalina farinacea]
MYHSALSTSSSSSLSLSKPPVFSSTSTSPAQTPPPSHLASQPRAQRPNTVYFHGGIGGAGNYRKVIRENNKAPRAYAENAEPRRRPSPTRFLSKVFGGQKGQGPGGAPNGPMVDARANGSEVTVKEEVSLGAAEVLRRKMIGGSRRKRAGS